MNHLALVPMRLAATVAHALPGVRLRLRARERTIVEVARAPIAAPGVIHPCGFRNAVARAHRELEAGQRLRFLGLDEGEAPGIDVAVAAPSSVRPGGLLSVRVQDAHVHAFATALQPLTCRQALATDLGAPGGLDLHHDAATDVTIVHAIRRGPDADELPAVLEEALHRCASEELAQELRGVGVAFG